MGLAVWVAPVEERGSATVADGRMALARVKVAETDPAMNAVVAQGLAMELVLAAALVLVTV